MGLEHALEGESGAAVRNQPHQRTLSARRRGGFTLLELAVALGVFVVFAVALTSVTTSALSTQSQLRSKSTATLTLERAAGEVAGASGFGNLVRGQIIVPAEQRSVCVDADGEPLESCPLGERLVRLMTECIEGLEESRQGCVVSGSSVLKVTYSVESQRTALMGMGAFTTDSAVKLFAFSQLPAGGTMTVTRTVATPYAGAGSEHGFVRVVLTDTPEGLFTQSLLIGGQQRLFIPQVRLLDADGAALVDWTALSPDGLMLRVTDAAGECTRARPCQVELDGGRFSPTDRFVSRGVTSVVLDPGRVTSVALQMASGPALLVRLGTLPERDPLLRGAPVRGSVCLWGTFDVPDSEQSGAVVTRAEAWCNNTNGSEVLIRGWVDDQGTEQELPEGDLTLWANPPYTRTVLLDSSGETVQEPVPGETFEQELVNCSSGPAQLETMLVWDGVRWLPGSTCTGWTWGMPIALALSVFSQRAFQEGATSMPLLRSVERAVTLYWSPQQGAPAAGCSAADPTWAFPRRAGDLPQLWDPGATEASGCTDVIERLREAPVWVVDTIEPFIVGLAYEIQLVASGTPAPMYRVSAGKLPDGVTLNESTGMLVGRPMEEQAFAFSITAESLAGSVTRSFAGSTSLAGGTP